MSACCNLRLHSPLKAVPGRIGDTYQAYCNTYKTHTMDTHHGGSRQPLDSDATTTKNATDVEAPQDFHHEDTDAFADVEHENPISLSAITREMDDLCQRIQAEEGQLTDSLHCIEWELQQLSISLYASAPPEPLEEVLKHCTDTLYSAQNQTHFTNTILQGITIFSGNDVTQLGDWLMDIETAAYLSAEDRTKLAQAKSKGLNHTLITEAFTSSKCWDDIRNLLC